MTHKHPYSLAFLAMAVLFCLSCERIEDPFPPRAEFDLTLFPGEPEDYPFPEFETSTNTVKNVLLEDFTGHKCVPCFAAAALAKDLEENNTPRVIVASIHASSTGVFQSLDSEHPTDFTTEAGDAYVAEMYSTLGGDNPLGTVNRVLDSQTYGVPAVWQVTPFWTNSVEQELATELQADIQVEINYYSDTDGLFVHARTDFFAELQGTFHVIHYLIRKEVVSPQSSPSGVVEDFEHHNVLTNNLNGTWGEVVSTGIAAPGFNSEIGLSFQLPSPAADTTFSPENLAVISFVIDRESFQILQSTITNIQ